MVNFIVLGQIPGTSIRLGFAGVMAMFLLICMIYLMRDYERVLIAGIKEFKSYQKAAKKLQRLWLDALQPKAKLLENKASLVPELALLLKHLKSGSIDRKSA